MNHERSFRVAVAIDFGTSRSGYAYAFAGSEPAPRIYERIDWPGMPVQTPKTLSHLLYAPTGVPEAWGAEARRRQAELSREANGDDYTFVHNFKMDLAESKSPNGPVTKRGTKTYRTEKLIADYLKSIKEMVLTDLAETLGSSLNLDELLWCLTVPAIWTESEKQIMRSAAQRAGLISGLKSDSDRLLFALEPEAAALHCARRAQVELAVNSRFMVVDCGGGTIDITSYEVLSNGRFRSLTNPTGGAFGSIYVDQEFLKYLRENTHTDAVHAFSLEEPTGYIKMLDEWERIKCHFDPSRTDSAIYFEFPNRFQKVLEAKYPDVLQTLLDRQNDCQGLDVTKDDMLRLFEPSLSGTTSQIDDQFRQLEKDDPRCDYIFLVGGFAASPALRQHVKEKFGTRVKEVVGPENPAGAIVNGAIYFALNPSSVPYRKVPYTYGCAFSAPFREGVDPTNKRWVETTGKVYCKDRFDVFVVADQEVQVDKEVSRSYVPSNPDATSMNISVFATKDPDPVYIDGKDIISLGEIEVQMPDITGGTAREVLVTMRFGKTEIDVSAVDATTTQRYDATIQFNPVF